MRPSKREPFRHRISKALSHPHIGNDDLTRRFSNDAGESRRRLESLRQKGGWMSRRLSSIQHELDHSAVFIGLLGGTRPTSSRKPKIPPLQRFRNYAKLALICVKLCKYSHEAVAADSDEYLSILQITQDYVTKTDDQDGLFFDHTLFKANKEQRLPGDARKILQKDFKYRSEKEIQYLHLVLRTIKAFSEYPTKMQVKLCRVGWYEAYESKRAIVRQGQPPHAFYFILSGSVVVTSFDRGTGGTTFLVALHRGMSFGELAVITRSRRQATVSTATTTELLCISAKDFVEIFMSGGLRSMTDPEQNSFIRSIPFLKYWPIECLASNPQACMFHFFPRAQVLVRDSNHSDWIYVVKSGSLSVLKKLVEVHPRVTRRNSDHGSEDEDEGGRRKSFGTWNFRIKKKRRESREEKEVFKNNIEMEKRLEQTLPGFYNGRERLGLIDYESIITDHRSRVLQTSRRTASNSSVQPLPKLPTQNSDTEETAPHDDKLPPEEDDKLLALPKIRKTSKGAYLATMKTKKKVSKKEAIQEELFKKQIEYDRKLVEGGKVGRKTITDELDNKLVKDFALTEKDIRPAFVQVQILERGQYFGLTKTVFPEQAESFSVVSNGAECIMISRRFFLEHANEQTMYHLRQVETLLPPEEELQANLQDFVDWKAHRARVYRRLVHNKHERNERKSQFPTQIGGQYCFRTGPTVRSID
ncbi:uncharacterized protein LOC128244528 isoform X1 [Mya arenaria]|uniref:uncharacterized protein LOC128244528 isoform X1 n=1 Tax=Mya arenaria TaxID=6604 RepID=UPI0022E4F90B|nr:uncharacterized protein LOC128244528 isoform X1 [Mya arenaria]